MAPRPAGGKADGVAVLLGAEIPSQHVDPTREYLFDRSIRLLQDAGALAGVKGQVAMRADGIVDALPVDGKLDVEELVRLESSPYFDALFTEEQLAIPELWKMMEAPTSAVVHVDLAPVAPLAVEERIVEPDALDIPALLPIAELPAPYHSALERLQLVHDADNDDTTVSGVDLDAAIAAPGAFTPNEVSVFKSTKQEFHYRATSQLSAVVAVSEPGVVKESVNVDVVQIVRTTQTFIDEKRSYVESPYSSDVWSVSLEARREVGTSPAVNNGERLLVVHRDSERGAVYRNFNVFGDTPSGTYLVELWENGNRKVARWAHLPELGQMSELLDLSNHAHQAVQTLGGTPLVRNTVKTSYAGYSLNCDASVHFRYELEDKPAPAANVEALLAVENSPIALPFGRYRVATDKYGDVFVDFFPEGAIRVTLPQESSWGHSIYSDVGYRKAFSFLDGTIEFYPSQSKLFLLGQNGQVIVLYKTDRIG
jgi:hypothetical protein